MISILLIPGHSTPRLGLRRARQRAPGEGSPATGLREAAEMTDAPDATIPGIAVIIDDEVGARDERAAARGAELGGRRRRPLPAPATSSTCTWTRTTTATSPQDDLAAFAASRGVGGAFVGLMTAAYTRARVRRGWITRRRHRGGRRLDGPQQHVERRRHAPARGLPRDDQRDPAGRRRPDAGSHGQRGDHGDGSQDA